jgi:hypothetical protein
VKDGEKGNGVTAKHLLERAMDRKEAEELALRYAEFGEWFNRTTSLTMAMSDKLQGKHIRRCLAEMQFLLDDAVRLPVRRDHPDLFSE